MSTRGCVAVRQSGGGWKGVFNHFDSYPTGFGSEVYEEAKKKGLKALAKEILKVGDWREYKSGGICGYCGKKAGQPHTIEGTIFGYSDVDYGGDRVAKLKCRSEKELAVVLQSSFGGAFVTPEMSVVNARRQWPIVQSMKKTGYPDPECVYHQHGEGAADQMTDKTVDTLFIEWIYVLDPVEEVIEIWHHRSIPGKVRKSGVSDYEHFKVTSIALKGPKPDWKKIEKLGRKMAGCDDED